MKKLKFTWIILFISITISATISLQIYWNIKNYAENRLRVFNEVQIAFDAGVDKYYDAESKKNTSAYYASKKNGKINLEEILQDRKINKKLNLNDIKASSIKKITVSNVEFKETKEAKPVPAFKKTVSYVEIKGKKAIDSVAKFKKGFEVMVMSINIDTIDLKSMAKLFELELQRKKIKIGYAIEHSKFTKKPKTFLSNATEKLVLKTESKSTFLPSNQKLKLEYSDPTIVILQRSLTGIVLSLMLSLSIIACMVYLFKIINKQKKIDAIKNDLIGNITHEFKTPITTISSAIEGIKSFSSVNDVEKTNRYLEISLLQINKLTTMVEKLLETASLDTDQLQLKKESVDLVAFLKMNIEKHKLFSVDNTFQFRCDVENLPYSLDAFHFENVISNLLDNAIKYGGNQIITDLTTHKKNIEISIVDNGNGIAKEHQDKIFEQFYRIPKGNIHDVKGFGIGLYYSKKIVEKHGGTLSLVSISKSTHFKITLPYEQI